MLLPVACPHAGHRRGPRRPQAPTRTKPGQQRLRRCGGAGLELIKLGFAGPRVRESGRGGLCILLAKAAQEGVGKPGLRSVPCIQILTTRNYFTPFSKTQGQLENAAGLQSYPLVRDGGGRLVHGPCTSCSGALFVLHPIYTRGGALSFCFRLLTTFGF